MRRATRSAARRLAQSVIVAAGVTAAPHMAGADWLQFVPRPFENHAWIETYGSYERDNYNASRNVHWDDTFFRERLSMASLGYSYDPRFLQYKLSLSGALKQEDYETSSSNSGGWDNATALEYDARLFVLPEHHYNAQIFASRHEPVYPQQAIIQHNNYLDDYGAIVRYRLKPWFLDADYLDSTLHQVGLRSNVKRLNVDGAYFERFHNGYELGGNVTVRPSWYDDSEGLDGSADEYLGSALVNLKHVRLDSTVTDNRFRQDRDSFDKFHTDQFAWWELLSVYFPWNLRTDLTWRLTDNDSRVDQAGFEVERHFQDDEQEIQLDVIHRLYESVDTRYRFIDDKRDAANSSSDLMSHSLTVDYTKSIPYGQLLAGGAFGRSDLDNRGFTSVINEPFTSTSVPGTITLRQQNIDASTIIVQLRSPVPPFDTIILEEGIHYVVNTSVEPFEIQFINLPPEFVLPGSFDFFLTYDQRTGDYDLQIDTGAASLTFDMFDSKVSPFFRYLGQRSDVSGDYPGVPIDSDSYNTGIRLVYGPLRARGEFLYLDWPLNPYRLWRTELQYVGTITRSISAYGSATYVHREYLGGEEPERTTQSTEQTETVSGTVTKQFYPLNLTLSVGGTYSHLSGITDSNAWSTTSSLSWHIGKLDVTLGVSAYGSDSKTRDSPSYERDHEMLFLNLRRQLL